MVRRFGVATGLGVWVAAMAACHSAAAPEDFPAVDVASARGSVEGPSVHFSIAYVIRNTTRDPIRLYRCGRSIEQHGADAWATVWREPSYLPTSGCYVNVPAGGVLDDTLVVQKVVPSPPGEWPYAGTGGEYRLILGLTDVNGRVLPRVAGTSSVFVFETQ